MNRNKRSLRPGEIGDTNLEWQRWGGSLPDGAVSIYNAHVERTDYVCKSRCEVGFYSPTVDSYCHYPLREKELRESNFDILVNRDNLEFLEWKDGSGGSVPPNSVMACVGRRSLYVGKNKYGLGKVHTQNKGFYLPWKGKEYWYKHYQVLTYDTDISNERISDVKYKLNVGNTRKRPQNILTSTITNNGCTNMKKTATLSKATQVTRSWNINASIKLSVKTSISAQIPLVASVGIELGSETTFQYGHGTTETESTTHSVTVEYNVPPNHSCTIRMEGNKYQADIPFTARLYRTYKNGKTSWTSISGTYRGVQTEDVHAVKDRCVLLPNSRTCPVN